MRATTTRAAAVSAGTLILCLTGGGPATAAMIPSPSIPQPVAIDSVPPPGDVVKLIQDTARTVVGTAVDKVTTAASPAKKAPASDPARPAAKHPVATPSRPSSTSVAPSSTASLAAWSLPAAVRLDAMPSLPSGLAGPAAQTPLVAARLAPTTTRVQDAARAGLALDRHGSSAVRAVLIALAAASAAALAVAHVAAVRGSGR